MSNPIALVYVVLTCLLHLCYSTSADQLFSTTDAIENTINMSPRAEAAKLVDVLSGCNQGSCPDRNAPFDMLVVQGKAYFYFVRVNDCGQCMSFLTSFDGCVDFTSCGQQKSVCVDGRKLRAHWLNKKTGRRYCYKLQQHVTGKCQCQGLPCHPFTVTPGNEVPCTW